MNKILSVFLCLIFLLSFASCTQTEYFFGDEESENASQEAVTEESENASQEAVTEEQQPYAFISMQERLSWKDKVITALSVANPYGEIEPGILGAALMDLNFDNTPELIVVGSGGSMGNVYIAAYNIESGEKMCVLGGTPHYQYRNNVYFCVHRSNDGKYIIVNEGSIRNGLEWDMMTSKLTGDFKFDTIFEEVIASDESRSYYCTGSQVDKAEFEKQKEQFKNDYKAITETQLRIIFWDSLEFETKSEAFSKMADALINSDQQFIQFDRDPVTDTLAPATSYEQAYLDFLKDKNESHRSFALVYVDGDDIPELYLKGSSEAEGDMVCSFKNGKVVCQQLGRTGGGSYIPKGGKIINRNGHMGMYHDNVYKLDGNGFSELLNAHYTETYEHIGNEEYITHRKYFISGSEVSEAEYNAAINSVFALQGAIRLDENAVSYEEIVRQLGGDYGGK